MSGTDDLKELKELTEDNDNTEVGESNQADYSTPDALRDPSVVLAGQEAAALMGKGQEFLRRRRKAGHISYYTMGNRIMYRREDIEEYLQRWCYHGAKK